MLGTSNQVDNEDDIHKVVILTRVKGVKQYCFLLDETLCRITILSDEECKMYDIGNTLPSL